MSKVSSFISKAKHAVAGKDRDAEAQGGDARRKKLFAGSRRSSISSNHTGFHAEDVSPVLPALRSETASMVSDRDCGEDDVEGLVSLAVGPGRRPTSVSELTSHCTQSYDDQPQPCFAEQPRLSAYLFRSIAPMNGVGSVSKDKAGKRAKGTEDKWDTLFVELRGSYLVFYKDAENDDAAQGTSPGGRMIPLNYLSLLPTTKLEQAGANPLVLRFSLPKHSLSLRSLKRDDSEMLHWESAMRERIGLSAKPSGSPKRDFSAVAGDSAVPSPAEPESKAPFLRSPDFAKPAEGFVFGSSDAVAPTLVPIPASPSRPAAQAQPFQPPAALAAFTAVDWTTTLVQPPQSSQPTKKPAGRDKGKGKEPQAAADSEASGMSRWFGMRWKDAPVVTTQPLSGGDAAKVAPPPPARPDDSGPSGALPRIREEPDDRERKGSAKRGRRGVDEKARTVDSRSSLRSKFVGMSGMVSRDDTYIVSRKAWDVTPPPPPPKPTMPMPGAQTLPHAGPTHANRMSGVPSAPRQPSPTRQSTAASELDADAPMTWAQRTVRREPSIMTATTGTSMSRRRRVVDSPVDNRHSIGDNRQSIGDGRGSIGDNRHSLAASNYSSNPLGAEPAGGVDLDNLPTIPVWLRKCVALVDEAGLDQEGIYRISGNASTVQTLKKLFTEKADEIELLPQSPRTSSTEELRSAVAPTATISIPIQQRPPSYHRRSMSFSGMPYSAAPLEPLPADPRHLYDNDIHVVTGVIKSILRDGFGPTKEPLIESKLYDRFLEVARIEDYRSRMIALQDVVHYMSPEHFAMLKHISEHLYRVSQNSHVNRMTSRNLAIVFTPTLMMKSPDAANESTAASAIAMNRLLVDTPVLSSVVETLIDYASWVFGPIEYEEEETGTVEEEPHEFVEGEGSVSSVPAISKEVQQRMSRASVTSGDRWRQQRSSVGEESTGSDARRPLSFEKSPESAAPAAARESVQWEGEEEVQRLRDALRRDRKTETDSLYRRKLRNRTQHLALEQWESLPEIASNSSGSAQAAQAEGRNVGLRWSWTPANSARDYGLSSSADADQPAVRPGRFSGVPEPRHREPREETEAVTNWRRSINSTHTTASTPSRKSVGSQSKRSNRPQSEVYIARPPSVGSNHRSSLVLSEA
ncbi:hypothetical protein DFJ74DRAFT_685918 [Hyaloraphidium curvatum]|nr:hypothetical protein DFJ74DRAFT_685918 [Hyaloraphidium curvatum]